MIGGFPTAGHILQLLSEPLSQLDVFFHTQAPRTLITFAMDIIGRGRSALL